MADLCGPIRMDILVTSMSQSLISTSISCFNTGSLPMLQTAVGSAMQDSAARSVTSCASASSILVRLSSCLCRLSCDSMSVAQASNLHTIAANISLLNFKVVLSCSDQRAVTLCCPLKQFLCHASMEDGARAKHCQALLCKVLQAVSPYVSFRQAIPMCKQCRCAHGTYLELVNMRSCPAKTLAAADMDFELVTASQ